MNSSNSYIGNKIIRTARRLQMHFVSSCFCGILQSHCGNYIFVVPFVSISIFTVTVILSMAPPANKKVGRKSEMDLGGPPAPPSNLTDTKTTAQRNRMCPAPVSVIRRMGLDLGSPSPGLKAFLISVYFGKK